MDAFSVEDVMDSRLSTTMMCLPFVLEFIWEMMFGEIRDLAIMVLMSLQSLIFLTSR